jgi:hypothetical protein
MGYTIQVLYNSAYLYDHDNRQLHTIPLQRLKWLWTQYHHSLTNLTLLEPLLQPFETKIIWLLHRYKNLQKTQYSLPTNILDHLITTFNITHTYFSSPLTCPTLLQHFYSPFPRDCIFGSLGTAFSHKWSGHGLAHPPSSLLPQAIHMGRLAAKENLLSYTILINTDPNWHQHTNPFYKEFPNIHVIVYIPPNSLPYHEPIKPIYDEDPYT